MSQVGFKGAILRIGAALALFLLSSCSEVPVAEELSQSQASEIVAVLNENGISASAARAQGGRGRYAVQVSPSRYSDAVVLLHRRGLPGEPRLGFDELISQRGLLPNSREMESLRFDRALAAEIEESISNNPAVLSVRALVRSANSAQRGQDAAATISIRLREEGKVDAESIKQLASRAVPGLSVDQVDVQIFSEQEAQGPLQAWGVAEGAHNMLIRVPLMNFLWIWRVPQDDYNGLALAFLGAMLLALVLGTGIGFGIGSLKSSKEGVGRGETLPLRRALPVKTGVVRRDGLGAGEKDTQINRNRELPGPK